MNSSIECAKPDRLHEITGAPGFADRLQQVLRQVVSVPDPAGVLGLLAEGARRLGASSACFISFVREADTAATYRMLLACDPCWGTEYLSNEWFGTDPWLSHALRSEETVLASAVAADGERERRMVSCARRFGFRSVVIAPAPSAAGSSRVGVLYAGADQDGFFEGDGYQDVRPLAQALSMEIHGWWMRSLRKELASRVRITGDELDLLRHEASGRGSKAIAAAIGSQAKTVDCRFQRLIAKLGVPNRKAAVKVAQLYGLL